MIGGNTATCGVVFASCAGRKSFRIKIIGCLDFRVSENNLAALHVDCAARGVDIGDRQSIVCIARYVRIA